MENQEINWNEAIQLEKEQKKQDELNKVEYHENLKLASAEVWDALSTDFFISSDVADIAMQYGVDEEDLIFSLI